MSIKQGWLCICIMLVGGPAALYATAQYAEESHPLTHRFYQETPTALAAPPGQIPYSDPDVKYWTNVAQVYTACKSTATNNRAFCAGFISGMDDTFTLFRDRLRLHCASDRAGISAYIDAFLFYMQEHAEVLEQAGPRGVALALQERFRCDERNSPVDPPETLPPMPAIPGTHTL